MAKTIGTAESTEISHDGCGKGIARVIEGVLHVECVRKGCREWMPLPGWVQVEQIMQILELIGTGRVSPSDILALADPLAKYRQIEDLIVIGPAELDLACRGINGENPLDLKDGWIPTLEVPTAMDQWIRSERWRTDKHWATRAALILTPPEIAGIPTSLIGQQKIWGVPHDGIGPGIVRQDVFLSNWFVGPNCDWANVPAVTEWQWMLVYEHLLWTTEKNWANQQKAGAERCMPISSVAQDVFALNVVLASTGIRLRPSTWSRTSTLFEGIPLNVNSDGDGVFVNQHWVPGHVFGHLAASAQGVPLNLDA